MSNRIIDVNTKKLDQAGKYVKTFQEDVVKACNDLHVAYDSLKEKNTEIDIAEIKEVIKKYQRSYPQKKIILTNWRIL